MKHSARLFLGLGLFSTFVACDTLNEAAKVVMTPTSTAPKLSNGEVITGLKEALNIGIEKAVSQSSVLNGFLNNAKIRLPFPEDAIKVKQKALEWGLSSQVEKFETTINRAAEEATKEALPIFKNALSGMSISDGFAILNGGNGAATNFLRNATTNQLITAFKPKVDAAIKTVKLTEYWNPIITKYNGAMSLTGGQKLNPDLSNYITERAIKGLFSLVEEQENKIRLNPAERVTDLLKKVFGSK